MDDESLASQRYISLETFKRDGTGVKTPVWCAPLDGRIVIFTEGTAWKVKRLRRDPKLRIAPCDARGRIRGGWSEGTGRVVEEPELEARAYAALLSKYGWQMRATNFFSRLAGRIAGRKVLEISLAEAAPSS
jgi:PPOX class probable F420-dependent enzyme